MNTWNSTLQIYHEHHAVYSSRIELADNITVGRQLTRSAPTSLRKNNTDKAMEIQFKLDLLKLKYNLTLSDVLTHRVFIILLHS